MTKMYWRGQDIDTMDNEQLKEALISNARREMMMAENKRHEWEVLCKDRQTERTVPNFPEVIFLIGFLVLIIAVNVVELFFK